MSVQDFLAEAMDIDLGIAALGKKMIVLSANANFRSTYGIEPGERLPEETQLHKLLVMADGQEDLIGVLLDEARDEGKKQRMLYAYHRPAKSGLVFYVVLFDVTEVCSLYERQFAREKSKLIGEMAAGTANSILNPLAVVRGSLQLIESTLKTSLASGHLSDRLVAQTINQYIALANHQVTEINHYVQRWLHLGKPFHVNLRPTLLSAFFQSYIPDLQKEAIEKKVSLMCEFPAEDRQLLIDPYYLREVLNEFFKNAFEASRTGSGSRVQMSVRLAESLVAITIRDSGIGISADLLQQVKDPFFTTKEEAVGLGLNYCEVVLQKMGGYYELTGDAKGTEVKVVLPTVSSD